MLYVFYFEELFSVKSLVYNKPANIGVLNNVAYWLTNHISSSICAIFIFLLFLISALAVCNVSNYLTRFICWLLVININNYLYPTLTAGDNLLNQLLFFNIFFNHKTYTNVITTDLTTALHNMALLGIKIQICLLYVIAGLFKLQDADWLNGSAIYHITQIPEYSNSLLQLMPSSVCVALTYATIIYQLTFPITIFIKPFKKYVFAFGVLQHLVIALAIGLFSFGIIMMLCYILFLKYDTERTVKKVLIN